MSRPIPPGGEYPRLGQALILLVLLVLAQLAAGIAAGLIVAIAGWDVGSGYAVVAVNVVASAGVLWWGLKKTRRRFGEVFRFAAFGPVVSIPLVIIAIGLSIVLSEADNLTRWLLPAPAFLTELLRETVMGGAGLAALVIVAPFAEELLFRGLILRGFVAHYSIQKAVVLSAAVFAVFHLNPYQFVSAFAIGLFLAWLFLRTRSLWPCIVSHALYNGLVWLAANVWRFDIPGYTVDLADPAALSAVEFQPLWFDVLGGLLCAGGLILLLRLVGRPDPEAGPLAPVGPAGA